MTIGPDIQEALDELGVSVQIQRYDSGTDTFSFSGESEKIFYKTNSQATRPFVREFFIEGQVGYQSSIQAGTVIKIHDQPFLTVSMTPVFFEDEIIKYNTVFYKCNVSGELQYLSGEMNWDRTTMKRTSSFVPRYVNAYALLTETDLQAKDIPLPPLGDKGKVTHQLYISSSYRIQERDRFIPRSGEAYKVDTIFRNVFSNVDLAILSQDTR